MTLNKCALIRLCVCVVGVFVVSINSLCLDVDLLSIVWNCLDSKDLFYLFSRYLFFLLDSKVKKKKLPAKTEAFLNVWNRTKYKKGCRYPW